MANMWPLGNPGKTPIKKYRPQANQLDLFKNIICVATDSVRFQLPVHVALTRSQIYLDSIMKCLVASLLFLVALPFQVCAQGYSEPRIRQVEADDGNSDDLADVFSIGEVVFITRYSKLDRVAKKQTDLSKIISPAKAAKIGLPDKTTHKLIDKLLRLPRPRRHQHSPGSDSPTPRARCSMRCMPRMTS